MSLTLALDRAPLSDAARNRNHETVKDAAKAMLLDALRHDIKRVVIPSVQRESGGRYYMTSAQNASDVLIDSATRTYEAQEALAQLLVDAARGADVSTRCQLILSSALERFADDRSEDGA